MYIIPKKFYNDYDKFLHNVIQANQKIGKAEIELNNIIKEYCTEGRLMSYENKGYLQHGKVIMVGHNGRIKVRNEKTRKEVWIYPYNLRYGTGEPVGKPSPLSDYKLELIQKGHK